MICTKCKVDKNDAEFALKYKATGKKLSNCRACQKIYARSHYLRNKDEVIKKVAKHKFKVREKFVEYLTGKSCITCGNNDIRVLEFDHREPSSKLSTISSLVAMSSSWSKILNEIGKCDILCANCHKIKTSVQFNWHKAKNNNPIV